jgi:hypothetical protein
MMSGFYLISWMMFNPYGVMVSVVGVISTILYALRAKFWMESGVVEKNEFTGKNDYRVAVIVL